jgi:hypothetical protein
VRVLFLGVLFWGFCFGGFVLGLEEEEQVVVGFSEISVGAGEDTGGFHSR